MAQSVPAARHSVRAICIRHGLGNYEPELVVSELVANALRHTGVSDFVGVVVRVSGRRMAIEVSDPASESADFLAATTQPAEDADSGRGLLLVTALSERVDVTVSKGRKTVRARLVTEAACSGSS